MLVIPLQPVQSQTVTVSLAQQPIRLFVYSKTTGLFVDVYNNDQPVVLGVVARNATRIVRERYRNFIGDLVFFDTQGQQNPKWFGLGTRWVLSYDEAA